MSRNECSQRELMFVAMIRDLLLTLNDYVSSIGANEQTEKLMREAKELLEDFPLD